jgi:hypothetical protein
MKTWWKNVMKKHKTSIGNLYNIYFTEHKTLMHDLMRIEGKLSEVDSAMQIKLNEYQILNQQKMNLENLHAVKQLTTMRIRPKVTFMCGFENFWTMHKYWELLPLTTFEYYIPNDTVSYLARKFPVPQLNQKLIERKICFLKGDAGNEDEVSYRDMACGRLSSTYPQIPELKCRVNMAIHFVIFIRINCFLIARRSYLRRFPVTLNSIVSNRLFRQ